MCGALERTLDLQDPRMCPAGGGASECVSAHRVAAARRHHRLSKPRKKCHGIKTGGLGRANCTRASCHSTHCAAGGADSSWPSPSRSRAKGSSNKTISPGTILLDATMHRPVGIGRISIRTGDSAGNCKSGKKVNERGFVISIPALATLETIGTVMMRECFFFWSFALTLLPSNP